MNTILISGAAGGLGHVVTAYFLERGWRVHASCSNKESQTALQTLFAGNTHCSTFVSDVSTEAGAQAFVQSFVPSAPDERINAVVCLAGGITAGTTIEETPSDVLDSMLTINLKTTFHLIAAALPALKPHGGSIVTIGAGAALRAEANKSAYAAAKAAVVALTQTAAEEGKAHNIRANVIVPGILKTAANLDWGAPDDISKWTPPEDVAATIYFLCSDAGKGVNGAVIPMLGGL